MFDKTSTILGSITFFEGMLLWPGWCGKRGPKVWISNYRTLIRIWEATKYAAEHRCKVVDTACQCPQVCLQTCRPAAMGPKKRHASVSPMLSFKNHIITCSVISSQFILTVWKTIPKSRLMSILQVWVWLQHLHQDSAQNLYDENPEHCVCSSIR